MEFNLRSFAMRFCEERTAFFARLIIEHLLIDYQIVTDIISEKCEITAIRLRASQWMDKILSSLFQITTEKKG